MFIIFSDTSVTVTWAAWLRFFPQFLSDNYPPTKSRLVSVHRLGSRWPFLGTGPGPCAESQPVLDRSSHIETYIWAKGKTARDQTPPCAHGTLRVSALTTSAQSACTGGYTRWSCCPMFWMSVCRVLQSLQVTCPGKHPPPAWGAPLFPAPASVQKLNIVTASMDQGLFQIAKAQFLGSSFIFPRNYPVFPCP